MFEYYFFSYLQAISAEGTVGQVQDGINNYLGSNSDVLLYDGYRYMQLSMNFMITSLLHHDWEYGSNIVLLVLLDNFIASMCIKIKKNIFHDQNSTVSPKLEEKTKTSKQTNKDTHVSYLNLN